MWTTTTSGSQRILSIVAAVLSLGAAAYAQKADPDGVKVITQKDADTGNVSPGDSAGFPVTISTPGSYRLGSNLVLPNGNTTGIEITSLNVVLDLNGFSILGPGVPGTGAGIRGAPGGTAGNITILNGTVRGAGSTGLDLPVIICRIERVHALDNQDGIVVHRGGTLVNNTVIRNRGIGISTGTSGNTVIGNIVVANFGLGMTLGAETGYAQNVVTQNNGGNANVQVTGGIQIGTNTCGTALCP